MPIVVGKLHRISQEVLNIYKRQEHRITTTEETVYSLSQTFCGFLKPLKRVDVFSEMILIVCFEDKIAFLIDGGSLRESLGYSTFRVLTADGVVGYMQLWSHHWEPVSE